MIEHEISIEGNLTSNVQTMTTADYASHPLRLCKHQPGFGSGRINAAGFFYRLLSVQDLTGLIHRLGQENFSQSQVML